jgi:glycosyltransferase involved in cell wall biosynthesis
LSSKVRFLGFRRDLERIYADLDIAVNSSINEGTPVALIEAMAAGVPVVATGVGGTPDLLDTTELGTLVPPANPPALSDAILRVFSRPPNRKRPVKTRNAKSRRASSRSG